MEEGNWTITETTPKNEVDNNKILNENVNTLEDQYKDRQKIRIKKSDLLKSLIPVVMRQTDYTEEECEKKLDEHNFDLKALLYEWNGIPLKKETKTCLSSNQERYRLMRENMDQASSNWYKK